MGTESFRDKLLSVQRNLLNFAYTLTSNREDAYDLLQDTTLKALDNADKYVDNVNFKGWVFTIMRNLFINRYRRESRTTIISDTSDDLYMLNISSETVYESPEGALSTKEIMATLNSFNDEIRVPFSMFISGYHYAEIAEHLSLPLGTVKSRIFQARKKLQSSLRDYR